MGPCLQLARSLWLYVAYNCGTPNPRLLRVQYPFYKLIAVASGGVIIGEEEVFRAAEGRLL